MSDGIPYKKETDDQWENLRKVIALFASQPGVQITLFTLDAPNGIRVDCQDEPHLIATDSEEADAILAMWEGGK